MHSLWEHTNYCWSFRYIATDTTKICAQLNGSCSPRCQTKSICRRYAICYLIFKLCLFWWFNLNFRFQFKMDTIFCSFKQADECRKIDIMPVPNVCKQLTEPISLLKSVVKSVQPPLSCPLKEVIVLWTMNHKRVLFHANQNQTFCYYWIFFRDVIMLKIKSSIWESWPVFQSNRANWMSI